MHIFYNFIRSFARNWRAVIIFSGIRYRLDYMLHPFKKVLEERNAGAFIGGRRLRAKVGKSHN